MGADPRGRPVLGTASAGNGATTRVAPTSSPLIPHADFPADAPKVFSKSRIHTSEAGQAGLQVKDIHQALNFATRATDVGWHRYAGAVDEERVVRRLRDLVDLPQHARLHANVTDDPFGPDTGPHAGPNRITIMKTHCRSGECGCLIEIR